jgi:hypothetical protein
MGNQDGQTTMLLTGRRGYLTTWIVWLTTRAVIAALHGVISCWHEAGALLKCRSEPDMSLTLGLLISAGMDPGFAAQRKERRTASGTRGLPSLA